MIENLVAAIIKELVQNEKKVFLAECSVHLLDMRAKDEIKLLVTGAVILDHYRRRLSKSGAS